MQFEFKGPKLSLADLQGFTITLLILPTSDLSLPIAELLHQVKLTIGVIDSARVTNCQRHRKGKHSIAISIIKF